MFKVDIYHRFESLEWATSYYWPLATPPSGSQIQDLADAEALLVSLHVNYNRWELFSVSGHKVDEGPISGSDGSVPGNMTHIHYALLLREAAPLLGRPSVKYIHGFTVNAFDTNGELSIGYQLAISSYGDIVSAAGWADSDGQEIEGMIFRGFSRRVKMRQIAQ